MYGIVVFCGIMYYIVYVVVKYGVMGFIKGDVNFYGGEYVICINVICFGYVEMLLLMKVMVVDGDSLFVLDICRMFLKRMCKMDEIVDVIVFLVLLMSSFM